MARRAHPFHPGGELNGHNDKLVFLGHNARYGGYTWSLDNLPPRKLTTDDFTSGQQS